MRHTLLIGEKDTDEFVLSRSLVILLSGFTGVVDGNSGDEALVTNLSCSPPPPPLISDRISNKILQQ